MGNWGNAIGVGLGAGLKGTFDAYQWLEELAKKQEELDLRRQDRTDALAIRREDVASQIENRNRDDRRARGRAVFDMARDATTDTPVPDADVADATFAGYGSAFETQPDHVLPGRAIGDTLASPGRNAGNYRRRTASEVAAERDRALKAIQARQAQQYDATEWDRRETVRQRNRLDATKLSSSLTAGRQAADDARSGGKGPKDNPSLPKGVLDGLAAIKGRAKDRDSAIAEFENNIDPWLDDHPGLDVGAARRRLEGMYPKPKAGGLTPLPDAMGAPPPAAAPAFSLPTPPARTAAPPVPSLTPPAAAAPAPSAGGMQIGQTKTLRDGTRVRITAVYPDGTFDADPIR